MKHNYCHSKNNQKKGSKAIRIIGMTFVGIVFAVLFAFLFGLIVQYIWNWLMPAIFGLTTITYWQAFGIVILAKILFGGFGGPPGDHPGKHDRHGGHFFGRNKYDENNEFIDDDWTSEEKEKYKKYWQEEGKSAFEAYLEKVDKEEKKDKEEEEKS